MHDDFVSPCQTSLFKDKSKTVLKQNLKFFITEVFNEIFGTNLQCESARMKRIFVRQDSYDNLRCTFGLKISSSLDNQLRL